MKHFASLSFGLLLALAALPSWSAAAPKVILQIQLNNAQGKSVGTASLW